jgi:CheY-like chemotaxis protein
VDALPLGGSISLSVCARGGRALLSVADDGIGMSDEVRERIFEPFFTTKGDRGTGLGLPTVFGIVEAHGGELSVSSEVGHGTRFELSFPLAEHAEDVPVTSTPTEKPGQAAKPEGTAGRRVLVVDDEPQLVRMLATMLRREGYEALQAASGEEALALLASEPPVDLLITDVGMGPSMNGWELAERARSDRPDLPVILATGWGATIDPDDARGRGICAILSKPYRRADLTAVLERVPWSQAGRPADQDAESPQARAS